jgi:hypothetical protein
MSRYCMYSKRCRIYGFEYFGKFAGHMVPTVRAGTYCIAEENAGLIKSFRCQKCTRYEK